LLERGSEILIDLYLLIASFPIERSVELEEGHFTIEWYGTVSIVAC